MGRISMGYWDCQQCGTHKIPGSDRECPNCGLPRPSSTHFYTDDSEPTKYVDAATEQQVRRRGRDWVCEYCNSLNSGLDDTCPSCGARRTIHSLTNPANTSSAKSKSEHRHEIEHTYPHEPKIIPAQPLRTEHNEYNKHDEFSQESVKRKLSPMEKLCYLFDSDKLFQYFKIASISLISIAIVAFIIYLLIPKPVEFTISDISWEYNIDIEKLTPVDESDWTMPPGATLRYTRMETHHYEDVPDGYKTVSKEVIDRYEEKIVGKRDLGNGYFEDITERDPVYKTVTETVQKYRKEPVEQLKYYYTIDKWLHYRDITTKGNDKSPYWGEVTLADKERERSRSKHYYISGADTDDKIHRCTIDYSFWQNCEIGDYVKGKVDVTGHFKPDTENTETDYDEN